LDIFHVFLNRRRFEELFVQVLCLLGAQPSHPDINFPEHSRRIPMNLALLNAHTFATIAMVGLIWLVQLSQYPGFRSLEASPEIFGRCHKHHVTSITYVVMPLMLIELCSSIGLFMSASGNARSVAFVGLLLVAIAWLSTALIQVPLHQRLSEGFDLSVVNRLIHTNWIRTLAWTLRGFLALYLSQITNMGETLNLGLFIKS